VARNDVDGVPPTVTALGVEAMRRAQKRKRPWGAGVFNSQLGGSWGS
jgi:hypothetical protein